MFLYRYRRIISTAAITMEMIAARIIGKITLLLSVSDPESPEPSNFHPLNEYTKENMNLISNF